MPNTALEALPDRMRCSLVIGSGDLTIGDLRESLARPKVINTSEAHRRWPRYSETTWRKRAREGDIPGAWQDEPPRGPWSLPLAGCQRFIDSLQERAQAE